MIAEMSAEAVRFANAVSRITAVMASRRAHVDEELLRSVQRLSAKAALVAARACEYVEAT